MINDLKKTKQAAARMRQVHTFICYIALDFGPCLEIETVLMEASQCARMLAGMARRMEEPAIIDAEDKANGT